MVHTFSDDDDDDEVIIVVGETITAKPLKKGRALSNIKFVENIQDNLSANGDYILHVRTFTIQ